MWKGDIRNGMPRRRTLISQGSVKGLSKDPTMSHKQIVFIAYFTLCLICNRLSQQIYPRLILTCSESRQKLKYSGGILGKYLVRMSLRHARAAPILDFHGLSLEFQSKPNVTSWRVFYASDNLTWDPIGLAGF
jgi:hypothetical protein